MESNCYSSWRTSRNSTTTQYSSLLQAEKTAPLPRFCIACSSGCRRFRALSVYRTGMASDPKLTSGLLWLGGESNVQRSHISLILRTATTVLPPFALSTLISFVPQKGVARKDHTTRYSGKSSRRTSAMETLTYSFAPTFSYCRSPHIRPDPTGDSPVSLDRRWAFVIRQLARAYG